MPIAMRDHLKPFTSIAKGLFGSVIVELTDSSPAVEARKHPAEQSRDVAPTETAGEYGRGKEKEQLSACT